jgi:ketosteroid isomerase-like protein
MFPNTPMIRGRNAIRAWGETDSPVVVSMSFSDIEIQGSGDWAWATSSYVAKFEGMDEPDRGKQLVVFQRRADGTWLTAAVHVSSDLPPPGN